MPPKIQHLLQYTQLLQTLCPIEESLAVISVQLVTYLAGYLYGSNVGQLAAVGKWENGGHVWGEVKQPVAMVIEKNIDAGHCVCVTECDCRSDSERAPMKARGETHTYIPVHTSLYTYVSVSVCEHTGCTSVLVWV